MAESVLLSGLGSSRRAGGFVDVSMDGIGPVGDGVVSAGEAREENQSVRVPEVGAGRREADGRLSQATTAVSLG